MDEFVYLLNISQLNQRKLTAKTLQITKSSSKFSSHVISASISVHG